MRTAAARWSDLRRRSLSAALLAPVALLCIWVGAAGWTVLMAAAAVGLGLEWASLCGVRATAWPGFTVPLLLVLAGVAAVLRQEAAALLVIGAGALLVWQATGRQAGPQSGRRQAGGQAGRTWALAAGIPYIGIPLVALVWLRGTDVVGRDDVVFLVLVVWASDIGAYAVGRAFGGPKLAPSISPGKTWSGALGGLVIAMLVGEGAAQALAPAPLGRAAAVACLLGVASAAGDLLESWIKRRFGVKDSGRLIPGHGGLLDRLDGLLGAAPAAAAIALALGRQGGLWR